MVFSNCYLMKVLLSGAVSGVVVRVLGLYHCTVYGLTHQGGTDLSAWSFCMFSVFTWVFSMCFLQQAKDMLAELISLTRLYPTSCLGTLCTASGPPINIKINVLATG